MKKIRELIILFKNLFPEESFLNGLTDLSLDLFKKQRFDSFARAFKKHLLFYGENLYPLAFEKIQKAGNLIFYHLQKSRALGPNSLRKIKGLPEVPKDAIFDLNEAIAQDFLKSVIKAYLDFDRKDEQILRNASREVLNKKIKKLFKNPTGDFHRWQANFYGLGVLDKKILLSEAKIIQKKIKKPVKLDDFYPDSEFLIKFFLDYFQNLLEEDVENVKVLKTPEYLLKIEPIAGAYIFDRLKENPKPLVFVNFGKKISTGKLMLILFHEIFGHVLHYNLMNKHCENKLKILSQLPASPAIEGFALLAEDYLLKIMSQKKTQKDFEKVLKKGFSGGKTFLVLRNFYFQSRLLRYLRYIFEYEIYIENKSPLEAITDISRAFEFDREFLREDLFSFLVTPGYGSCYIGGYKIVKELGNYQDFNFRKSLVAIGFDFINNF